MVTLTKQSNGSSAIYRDAVLAGTIPKNNDWGVSVSDGRIILKDDLGTIEYGFPEAEAVTINGVLFAGTTAEKIVAIQDQILSVTSGSGASIPFVTANALAINSVIYSGSVKNAKTLFLQQMGASTAGTVAVQFSNDGIVWSPDVYFLNPVANAPTIATTANVLGIYRIPVQGRFVKVYAKVAFTVSTIFTLVGETTEMPLDFAQLFVGITGNLPGFATAPTVIPSTSASAGGFVTNYRLLSLATTNGVLVSTGAHRVGAVVLSNTSATAKYFKMYNKATAPVVGTDVPILTVLIPAGQTVSLVWPMGLAIATGLGIGITGGVADADTTAVVLNDVIVNISYT